MLTVHGYVESHPTLGKTDTGGQVKYVLELSKTIAKKGIKVDIYTRQFQHKKSISNVSRGVRIIRIPCGGKKFIPKERLLPYLDTFVRNMDRFIRKEGLKYDIYHSHYWDSGYVAMKLTEKIGYFFVHTFHSLGAWKKDNMGGDAKEMEKIYRFKERIRQERMIYGKTRALVMTSIDMVKNSKELYGYTGKNHIVVPAGVNTDIYRPLKRDEKEKRIDVPHNYIFWVGRFDTNKGLTYLLKAFAEIVTRSKDLFLVLGGGSKHPKPKEKKLIKELHRIIRKKQIKSRVFFTHHIPDKLMPSYYRRARFFVLPSKFEPFGMTAAEAMACGTPAIVSNRSGIRKYLKNGENCLIVNPSNKRKMSEAFSKLDKSGSLLEKISGNALRLARDKFSWVPIAEKNISFYNKLYRDNMQR